MAAYLRTGAVAILSILSLFADAGPSCAAQTKPEDALVLVTSHWRDTRMSSHGFVVGDGSLVVAFYPAVFDELTGGRHRLAKRVTVASPYWGEVVDAEVVASDARKQLAILQVPWRGHPALRLADDKSIADAERMRVVGMPRVIEVLSGKSPGPVDASALFQETMASVDYVAVREGKSSFVALPGGSDISLPWAGTPILLPDTGRVAATVSFLLVNGGAEGGVLNRMEGLVERLRGVEPVMASETEHPSTGNAHEAFLRAVQIAALFGHEKYEETTAECRKLIELRPQCFYGYVYAALAAEELGQTGEADRLYREAVTRAPDSLTAKVSYGGFLDRQGRLEEALQVLEPLWPRTALRPYLSDAICTVLIKQREHTRCIRFLEEALAVEPNNAYALIHLGNSRNALQEYGAAADAFGKAADLWPEHETVRAHCARNLERAGRLDEAEMQYRQSVRAHPESEYAHHMFASFLARHRPELKAEALSEARAALRLHPGDAADKEEVERLIRNLEAKGE